ncbi:MAG: hypothetical protein AAFZ65_00720 [Planctomycetota bacterium]
MAHLTPILLVLQSLGALQSAHDAADPDATVVKVNPDGTSYIDHEFHPFLPEMVYQSSGAVWTRTVDALSGLFSDADEDAVFVDLASSLQLTRNGPEYGWDSGGVSIFYNKSLMNGAQRIWRATPLAFGGFNIDVLSPGNADRINQLPSQWSQGKTTWLVYGREPFEGQPAMITSAREDDFGFENENPVTEIVPGFAGFRWLRGTSMYTVTEAEGDHAGEVLLVDAATGDERRITDDDFVKFDPYPWHAPEFQDRLCVAAIVDEKNIAVYVDFGGEFFTRISVIEPPSETQLEFAQSPEPFISGNRSFISLTLADNNGNFFEQVNESEIWVYSIFESGPLSFARRFDDGLPGQVRHEAETLSGPKEVLLYYNLRKQDENGNFAGFDLYRVRTGLRPDPDAPTAQG